MAGSKVVHLLTEEEAASVLAVSPAWLRRQRTRGESPPYVRLSSHTVRYWPDDLARFAAERRQEPVSCVRRRGRVTAAQALAELVEPRQ